MSCRIDELVKGNLADPFVAGLVAEAYAKLGDRATARPRARAYLGT